MKTATPQDPTPSFARTFRLQEIEHNMSHAHQLRSNELADIASLFVGKAEDLIGAVRRSWTVGVGLNNNFHRA